MARELAIESKRFEGRAVKPSDLIVNQEENGRAFPYTPDDVVDILKDLNAGRGILQAVTVEPVKTEAGQFLKLIAGYRRWYASMLYAKDHPDFLIPTVLQSPKDSVETLILNVRENVARNALSIIDYGHLAVRFAAMNKTQKEIKEILGLGSEAQVSRATKLVTELNESLQVKVHKGEITADDAFNLLKVEDPEKREKIVQEALAATVPVVVESNVVEVPVPAPRATRAARGDAIRTAVQEAGGKVTKNLAKFKKYLAVDIEEEGPGSNKNVVELKKAIVMWLEGELTDRQLDNRFEKLCK